MGVEIDACGDFAAADRDTSSFAFGFWPKAEPAPSPRIRDAARQNSHPRLHNVIIQRIVERMGIENVKNSSAGRPFGTSTPIEFPVRENLTYLNHAAVAPLPRRTAEAIRHLADDCLHWGSYHYSEWLEVYEASAVRPRAWSTPARGDRARQEHVGGHRDHRDGARLETRRPHGRFPRGVPRQPLPVEAVGGEGRGGHLALPGGSAGAHRRGRPGAKLLAISFVNFLSGYRAPIQAIGEICRRNHCIYFVDAIQGLGAFPLDVEACHIDALAADGHKWMLGPEGCAILYIRRELQDRVEPVEFGWTNVAGYDDYGSRDMTLRQDAGRYECGTLNTIGCFGLKASLDFLLEVGPGRNCSRLSKTWETGSRPGCKPKATSCWVPERRKPAAGIVSFRKPGVDAAALVRILERENPSPPRVPAGYGHRPHFYISPSDIDRMLDVLP